MKKVLVVEDDAPTRELVVTLLAAAGYLVLAAPNGRRALELCAQFEPDLTLLDLRLPRMDGFAFLRHQGRDDRAPVVVMSAAQHREQLAANIPLLDFIEKPFEFSSLIDRVDRTLQDELTRAAYPNGGFGIRADGLPPQLPWDRQVDGDRS